MTKKKLWKWILLGVFGLTLVVTFFVVEIRDRQLKRRREELFAIAEPLERQVNQLVNQREALRRQLEEDCAVPATEQLLFLELDPMLFEEAFPLMLDRGIPGVLALEEGNLPGDSGRLSRTQYDRLLAEGWETCLICRDISDFEAWDQEMSRLLKEAGLEKPKAVYFSEKIFDPRLNETILRCGYTVAIHHGEGKLNQIAGDADKELWLCGASVWNGNQVKDSIRELIRRRGQRCYTLRFPGRSGTETKPDTEIFYTERFVNMLEFVQPYLDDGSLRITGLMQARDMHDPEKNGANEAKEQWALEDAALEEQIRGLRAQIRSIYLEWGED